MTFGNWCRRVEKAVATLQLAKQAGNGSWEASLQAAKESVASMLSASV